MAAIKARNMVKNVQSSKSELFSPLETFLAQRRPDSKEDHVRQIRSSCLCLLEMEIKSIFLIVKTISVYP